MGRKYLNKTTGDFEVRFNKKKKKTLRKVEWYLC